MVADALRSAGAEIKTAAGDVGWGLPVMLLLCGDAVSVASLSCAAKVKERASSFFFLDVVDGSHNKKTG